jgi:hypothetical protein
MNKLIRRIEFYAFLVPIIAVAFVSISHVTTWYGIANPNSWAIYLSVGIEVAALSALAGFTVGLGRLIYFPFILVTFIQFVGNVFYNFQFIDVDSELFKDWVSLVSPLLVFLGVEPENIEGHKRVLAFLEGGFLPAISLFFLHLLIKLSEKIKETEEVKKTPDIEELSRLAGILEREDLMQNGNYKVMSEDELDQMEKFINEMKKNGEEKNNNKEESNAEERKEENSINVVNEEKASEDISDEVKETEEELIEEPIIQDKKVLRYSKK